MEGDANDRMGRRAAMLAVTAVTGAGVVVTPVLPQLNGYIFDEAKLKSRYTVAFHASHAQGKLSLSLSGFYQACCVARCTGV